MLARFFDSFSHGTKEQNWPNKMFFYIITNIGIGIGLKNGIGTSLLKCDSNFPIVNIVL